MEIESTNKELAFLEIRTMNNGKGRYEFDVYRKKAITNVQVKPDSSHDPRVLKGIFKGFVYRALKICSNNFFEKEIDFLIEVFTENGYERSSLKKMANEVITKHRSTTTPTNNSDTTSRDEPKKRITLPWIPKVSPKLKSVYKKAGYDVAFKSGKNMGSLLSFKNKSKLPRKSYPDVQM